MDATSFLKIDHRRIRDLMDGFAKTSNPRIREILIGQLRFDIDSHHQIKEQVFYPDCIGHPDLQSQAVDCRKEMNYIREYIDRLANGPDRPSARDEWLIHVKSLFRYIERHIQNEEEGLFRLFDQAVATPDRERMGRHMKTLRENPAAYRGAA